MKKLVPLTASVAAATALAVVPAQATFKGTNGLLVYQAQGDGFCRRRPDAKITAIAGKVGAERGSHGVAKSAVGHVC